MWFRIRNSNEDLRGSALIGGTGKGDTPYVTGTWRP